MEYRNSSPFGDYLPNHGVSFSWESSELKSDHLSAAKLKQLACTDDLDKVDFFEMVVDTSEVSLGNFGQHLPNLSQLKLSESNIPSVRDIGSALGNLRVLWLSRCSLTDVNGIASLQNLRELYVAYNNIEDASPVSFLDDLEVLDLEANKIKDKEQIEYFCMMSKLCTLTLIGNPLAQFSEKHFGGKSYRRYVLSKLPKIKLLDDVDSSVMITPSSSSSLKNDVDIITKAIRDGLIDESEASVFSKYEKSSLGSQSPEIPLNFTSSPKTSRPSSSTIQKISARTSPFSPTESKANDNSSTLTLGGALSGSPINLLRNRRKDISSGSQYDYALELLSRPSTSTGVNRTSKLFSDSEGSRPSSGKAGSLNLSSDDSFDVGNEGSKASSSSLKVKNKKQDLSVHKLNKLKIKKTLGRSRPVSFFLFVFYQVIGCDLSFLNFYV